MGTLVRGVAGGVLRIGKEAASVAAGTIAMLGIDMDKFAESIIIEPVPMADRTFSFFLHFSQFFLILNFSPFGDTVKPFHHDHLSAFYLLYSANWQGFIRG